MRFLVIPSFEDNREFYAPLPVLFPLVLQRLPEAHIQLLDLLVNVLHRRLHLTALRHLKFPKTTKRVNYAPIPDPTDRQISNRDNKQHKHPRFPLGKVKTAEGTSRAITTDTVNIAKEEVTITVQFGKREERDRIHRSDNGRYASSSAGRRTI